MLHQCISLAETLQILAICAHYIYYTYSLIEEWDMDKRKEILDNIWPHL